VIWAFTLTRFCLFGLLYPIYTKRGFQLKVIIALKAQELKKFSGELGSAHSASISYSLTVVSLFKSTTGDEYETDKRYKSIAGEDFFSRFNNGVYTYNNKGGRLGLCNGSYTKKATKKNRTHCFPGEGVVMGVPHIISGTGKATDFKFGQYIQRVLPNKILLKILEKRERVRIQGLPNFFRVPPIISGTGKATKFKFCTHIYRLNRNKSPLKISGKVAVDLGLLSIASHPQSFSIDYSSKTSSEI